MDRGNYIPWNIHRWKRTSIPAVDKDSNKKKKVRNPVASKESSQKTLVLLLLLLHILVLSAASLGFLHPTSLTSCVSNLHPQTNIWVHSVSPSTARPRRRGRCDESISVLVMVEPGVMVKPPKACGILQNSPSPFCSSLGQKRFPHHPTPSGCKRSQGRWVTWGLSSGLTVHLLGTPGCAGSGVGGTWRGSGAPHRPAAAGATFATWTASAPP